MRIAGIAAAALLAAACAGGGDRASTGGAEAALQQQADPYNAGKEESRDKVVCEMEAVTGSRMKKEVCRTVSEMERDEENAERALRQAKPLPEKGS